MKIRLKNTQEQVELIKAMGSKDKNISTEAQTAFAAFIGGVIQQVLNMAASSNAAFAEWSFNEDDSPSFPLDMFYGTSVNEVQVWQQNMAGGVPSSLVTGLQELKFTPYQLDSAVSLLTKNVRRGRLPYVSLALNRMAQELLRKQELNRWSVVLKALAEASTNGGDHINGASTANVLQLDDFNKLLTLSKRINAAFDGSSTSNYSGGITDMFLSPEMMEQIRGLVYQPQNTRYGSLDTNGSNYAAATAVALPDGIREQIYRNAGTPEVFGIMLHEMLELGVAKRYSTIFDAFYSGSAPTFTGASDELVIGVDAGREALIAAVATNDNGTNVTAAPDDSFSQRSQKIGFYSVKEEASLIVDSRALVGLIV